MQIIFGETPFDGRFAHPAGIWELAPSLNPGAGLHDSPDPILFADANRLKKLVAKNYSNGKKYDFRSRFDL